MKTVNLERNPKAYAILGRGKKSGKLVGYVEHSFSMGVVENATRIFPVRVYTAKLGEPMLSKYRQQTQDSIIASLTKDMSKLSASYPGYEWFIVRVNSKNCPVRFFWNRFRTATGKYEKRNVGFEPK